MTRCSLSSRHSKSEGVIADLSIQTRGASEVWEAAVVVFVGVRSIEVRRGFRLYLRKRCNRTKACCRG